MSPPLADGTPQGDDPKREIRTRRVLIIDRRRLFGEALRHSLIDAGYTTVGIATSTAETQAALRAGPPDVAIISAGFSEATEIGIRRAIASGSPGCPVILLVDEGHSVPAERLGTDVQGLVSKATPASKFVKTVEEFLSGNDVPQIRPVLHPGPPSGGDALGRLTTREREVLQLLASGATSERIAERFGVQANTARKHIQNILMKLQVHSRLEAVAVALRKGIVRVPDLDDVNRQSIPRESMSARLT